MDDLGNYLGLHPLGALATVIATVVLYLCFAWVLRLPVEPAWAIIVGIAAVGGMNMMKARAARPPAS